MGKIHLKVAGTHNQDILKWPVTLSPPAHDHAIRQLLKSCAKLPDVKPNSNTPVPIESCLATLEKDRARRDQTQGI
jgi:hypothetical protein